MTTSTAATFLAAVALLLPARPRAHLSDVQIKVHPVAGPVHMLEGAGGNIGVSAGPDGILLIDAQFGPLADKIRAALRGIVDKPVRYVISTHWHTDHVDGNAGFARTGATIVAHDGVRRRMVSGGRTTNLVDIDVAVGPSDPLALPVVTFAQELTLHLNGEDVRVWHAGAGHTDGDAVVFFPRSNVVHLGDAFVAGFPFIDLGSGGSVKGLIRTLEAVLARIPKDAKVIPGHGPLSTTADVRQFLADVKESVAIVEKAQRAGRTLPQLIKGRVLAKFEKRSSAFVSVDAFTEAIFHELSGKKAAGP